MLFLTRHVNTAGTQRQILGTQSAAEEELRLAAQRQISLNRHSQCFGLGGVGVFQLNGGIIEFHIRGHAHAAVKQKRRVGDVAGNRLLERIRLTRQRQTLGLDIADAQSGVFHLQRRSGYLTVGVDVRTIGQREGAFNREGLRGVFAARVRH